jgi:hypothetical protein
MFQLETQERHGPPLRILLLAWNTTLTPIQPEPVKAGERCLAVEHSPRYSLFEFGRGFNRFTISILGKAQTQSISKEDPLPFHFYELGIRTPLAVHPLNRQPGRPGSWAKKLTRKTLVFSL